MIGVGVDLGRLTATYGSPVRPDEQDDVRRCEQVRAELLTRDEPIGDVYEAQTAKTDVTTVAKETANASCRPEKALFLYRLVRELRPSVVVEFGSALGVSGAYLASALRRNGEGRLVTVEGSPSRQSIAAGSIEAAAPGVTTSICGYFDDHLDVLAGADLFFNDGNHNEEPVLRYAQAALERMSRPSVLVLDDAIGYSEGMTAAWNLLRVDRRFGRHAEAGPMGLLSLPDPAASERPRLLRRLARRS